MIRNDEEIINHTISWAKEHVDSKEYCFRCLAFVEDALEKNWGHVGLSIGNGDVIHAWDKVRVDNYLAVESLPPAPGWEKPKFIGWVPLERIMLGYQSRIYD